MRKILIVLSSLIFSFIVLSLFFPIVPLRVKVGFNGIGSEFCGVVYNPNCEKLTIKFYKLFDAVSIISYEKKIRKEEDFYRKNPGLDRPLSQSELDKLDKVESLQPKFEDLIMNNGTPVLKFLCENDPEWSRINGMLPDIYQRCKDAGYQTNIIQNNNTLEKGLSEEQIKILENSGIDEKSTIKDAVFHDGRSMFEWGCKNDREFIKKNYPEEDKECTKAGY